jgi:transposase-like protein
MPKLRKQIFETAIIERHRRWEVSIEKSLIERHLAGVSVRNAVVCWGLLLTPTD